MKKIINLILAIVIAVTGSFCEIIIPVNAVGLYFKGRGTEEDPYLISSSKDLFQLAELINNEETNPNYRTCFYKQTKDIDLNNEPFTPIGFFWMDNGETTVNRMFSGVYDGNFHSICNFYLDYDSEFKYDYAGLFGEIRKDSNSNNNPEVKNLSVYGNLTGYNYFLGGIVGEVAYGGKISNCSFSGTLTGENSVGGIAGKCYQGATVENCYVNAKIIGNSKYIGGIVGENVTGRYEESLDITISNSYFTGNISGNEFVGGICGRAYLNGNYDKKIIFKNNYYLSTACTGGVNGENELGCTKLSEIALKSCADMLGTPFVDNEDTNLNDGYPIFEWQSTPYPFQGSGTAEDPFQISNKKELEEFQFLVNSTYFNPIYGHAEYIQTSDIDLENESWIPIGLGHDDKDGLIGQGDYNWKNRMFFGKYNGNRHKILNLNIDRNYNCSGLFGFIRGASTICNLIVYGSILQSNDVAGGIVGELQYGSSVDQCAFIGNVNSKSVAGGVVGCIWAGGSILNCYHNGIVSSDNIAGGVVGQIRFGEYNQDGDFASVKNCYHVNGLVTGITYNGGITGNCSYYDGIQNTISVENCYFSSGSATNTNNADATLDNTLALPGSLLKKIAEDLGEAYTDNADATLNNGYPVFKWQVPSNLLGDVNNDGRFDVSDVVMMQKWILGFDQITNWANGDWNEDHQISIIDLCLMKQKIEKN